MRELQTISSITHAMMKFLTPRGIATLVPRTAAIFECRQLESKRILPEEQPDEGIIENNKNLAEEDVMINPAFMDQRITIGTQFSPACQRQLVNLLRDNKDVFAWQPSDMVGVPRRIIQHSLNVNLSITPVAQKQRVLGPEKSKAVMKEVEEWIKAGIVRPVQYPTWISNPVLVKKVDDTWRMCIDFKNVNSACPKDYYPLPEIDLKIEAVMGFPFKCFLDAYKGYHQIQMSEEDEDKTAFYTDQVQLGRNLKAYVDEMVIKSKTGQEMIMDIAETFDNLRKVNMKLNTKKCSFRVKKRKFLRYTVTSKGVRANPKKTKAVAEMQSPKTLKEMQSLKAKQAFQEMKNLIVELPTLTTPGLKETLYVYLAASKDAILNKPDVSEKLAKYAVELGAYNITYVPQNVFKGQVLADFLNEVSVGTKHSEVCNLTDGESLEEWTLFTDGASSLKGAGVGLVLIDPAGTEYTYAIWLNFTSTNNDAGYEALLVGLRIAEKIKVQALKVKVDSKLVAYVLSKLASVAFNHLMKEVLVEVLNTKSIDTREVSAIVAEEKDNWMTLVIRCLEEGIWSADENEARTLWMKISQYVIE
ncbi:reverse transcriptase domain-containing protein [Tanacetum coccineum]